MGFYNISIYIAPTFIDFWFDFQIVTMWMHRLALNFLIDTVQTLVAYTSPSHHLSLSYQQEQPSNPHTSINLHPPHSPPPLLPHPLPQPLRLRLPNLHLINLLRTLPLLRLFSFLLRRSRSHTHRHSACRLILPFGFGFQRALHLGFGVGPAWSRGFEFVSRGVGL